MAGLAGCGVFYRIACMARGLDNQMAFEAIFRYPVMVKRPGSKGSAVAICAILAKAIGYMIAGAGILVKMATNACRACVPVNSVPVTILAFRCPVPPDQRIACLTVIKLSGIPCLFTMALCTVLDAKLIEVWICMALTAKPADPFILSFGLVTACANNVIMDPL